MEVGLRVFLTSALNGGEWSSLFRGLFTRGKSPLITTEQEANWAPEPVWNLFREVSVIFEPHAVCVLFTVPTDGEGRVSFLRR